MYKFIIHICFTVNKVGNEIGELLRQNSASIDTPTQQHICYTILSELFDTFKNYCTQIQKNLVDKNLFCHFFFILMEIW